MSHRRAAHRAAPAAGSVWNRAALLLAAGLVVLPPIVVLPGIDEAFTLPKLLLAELLALAAALCLSTQLPKPWPASEHSRFMGSPVIWAVLPFVMWAAFGLFATTHPLPVRTALVDLAIGAVFLVACAEIFRAPDLRRLVELTALPGAVLALVGILQFHGLYQPFDFGVGGDAERLRLTSLAGATGDLGAYLAFVCLVAQLRLARDARHRGRWLAVLGICAYALALTRTLTALVALAVASAVAWGVLVPRKRWLRVVVALEIEPRPEIYFNLGLVEARRGRSESARENLRRALRLDPRLRKSLPPGRGGPTSWRRSEPRWRFPSPRCLS